MNQKTVSGQKRIVCAIKQFAYQSIAFFYSSPKDQRESNFNVRMVMHGI